MGVPGRSPRTLAGWGPSVAQDAQARPAGAVASDCQGLIPHLLPPEAGLQGSVNKENAKGRGLVGASSWAAPETSPPNGAGSSGDPQLPGIEPAPGCQKRRESGRVLTCSLPLSEGRFFNYCGLERALVEVLGAGRFSPQELGRRRQPQPGTSPPPGLRRHPATGRPAKAAEIAGTVRRAAPEAAGSERDGRPQVSVVERNARVIQ